MGIEFTPEQQVFVRQAIESGRLRHPEEAAQEAFLATLSEDARLGFCHWLTIGQALS